MKKLLFALLILPFTNQAQTWNLVGSAGFSLDTAYNTSIAINSSGTPYVVYQDAGFSNKATVMKFNGSSWVNVGSAGFSAGGAENTSIAIDGSGTPYVVYSDGSVGNAATVMKFNGSSWVNVGSVGFSYYATLFTSIAIDGSGTPYVVYPNGGDDEKASVMKYNDTSWGGGIPIGGSCCFSAGVAHYTSIAIDGSGTPYVVYEDGYPNGPATVMKFNGSSWVNVGSPGFSAGGANFTSIAIDGSGTPYVVYEDGIYSGRATVKKFNGSSWVHVGSPGFSAGASLYTSIAIDGSGTPYVVYVDGSVGNAATVMKFNGSSWVNVGSPGFSAGEADYTSIAIDGSGTPYVVYVDGSVGNAATVMKFGTTPSPIIGSDTICVGETTTLSDITTSGIWSSANTSIATIGTSTGFLTGAAEGTDTISYTVSGISTTFRITVNPLPLAGTITGVSSVCAGSSITLTDIVTGGVWSSSNTSLATIGIGVVTGVSTGLDTIKYTFTNVCGTATATKNITINPLPSGITGTTNVCAGLTITLDDISTGGVWSSSSTSIAAIGTSGIITSVLSGTAIITYSLPTGCTTTKIITVNPVPVAGTIIGLTSVCVGSDITLSDVITGGTWNSSNSNAFVSSAGVVYGITAGMDNISYSVTNSCGTASVDTAINILDCATEIKKISNQSTPFITIFPNPNKGLFTVNISTPDNEDAQIVITNLLGEKVKVITIPTNKKTDVHLQSPAGIYFISAVTKNESITNKIIIE